MFYCSVIYPFLTKSIPYGKNIQIYGKKWINQTFSIHFDKKKDKKLL